MTTGKEMEGYARECVRLARLTDDPEIRDQLMQMARDWMADAMGQESSRVDTSSFAFDAARPQPLKTSG
jgi:hypothetical protein